MSLRSWMVLGAVVAAIGADLFLLFQEKIPSKEQTTDLLVRTDPLRDLVYSRSQRKENFLAFGMDDALAERTVRRAEAIEARQSEGRIRALLLDANQPTELVEALCGNTSQLRPRYGALRFFVMEDGDLRKPIDLQRISALEYQDWAKRTPIDKVYEDAELIDSPQEDATLMAIAALLTRNEQLLLEQRKPWGRGLVPGAWSWEEVVDQHPEVEELVTGYFALMHIAAELASADGGICGQ